MKLKINDFEMAYRQAGQGPAIVFVHGFPLSKAMWIPQLEGLKDLYHVITPDQRGHGESQPVAGPYTMQMLAQDIDSLLDTLEIDQPVVMCGHSMGGYVVFEFFRRYAHRTTGLILDATRAGSDTPEAKDNRENTARNVLQDGVMPVVEGMLPKMFSPLNYEAKPELVKEVKHIMAGTSPEGTAGALLAMRDRADSIQTLTEIRVPVLIIHGQEDQIIPVTEAQLMSDKIPQNTLSVLENAGHLPNLEDPVWFNDAVRRFMDKL